MNIRIDGVEGLKVYAANDGPMLLIGKPGARPESSVSLTIHPYDMKQLANFLVQLGANFNTGKINGARDDDVARAKANADAVLQGRPKYPWPTHTKRVRDVLVVRAIMLLLLGADVWFAVMPLPDDVYEITVKDEDGAGRTLLESLPAKNI